MELTQLEEIRRRNRDHSLFMKTYFLDLFNIPSNFEARQKYVNKKLKADIVETAKLHYQKYDDDHWNMYIQEWLPLCNAIIWTSYNNLCTGLAICIIDNQAEIYIRLLCSMCHCGGQLLQYIQSIAVEKGIQRIRLHSEPKCVGFYKKYGFYVLNENYETNILGVRYPTMIYGSTLQQGETVCTKSFFFGIMYYIEELWQYLLFIIGGILAFVCM